MVFRKLFAAVGVGGGDIETTLAEDAFMLGTPVSGTIALTGGSVDQDINGITLEVGTRFETEREVVRERERPDGYIEEYVALETVHHTRILAEVTLGESFTLAAGEEQSFDFTLEVPPWTPVTVWAQRPATWLRSELDIHRGRDDADRDPLVILPPPVMTDVFRIAEDLGFRLTEVSLEGRGGSFRDQDFVQEFEFRAPADSGLEEAEFVFLWNGEGYDLLIQKDRRVRGLRGLILEEMGADETWERLTLDGGLEGPGVEALSPVLSQILAG